MDSSAGAQAVRESRFPAWKAARRRFLPDHSFFSAGNVERELQAKQISLNISDDEMAYIGRIEDEERWVVSCSIVGCGADLKGLEELESHYLTRHTATCSVCSRVFPTKRLLNIHIAEAHDSFFKAKVARGHPMYECLVEGCPNMFLNDKARHQHLVDKHKFPPSFEFHKKKHPSQKQRQRSRLKVYMEPKASKTQTREADSQSDVAVTVEDLSSAISRLSTAESSIPETISFGRRRGRGAGLAPVFRGKAKVSSNAGTTGDTKAGI